MKNIIKLSKNSYKLIAIMIAISIIAIITAKIYYGNINKSEDPRTIHIRELYKKYTLFVKKNDFDNAVVTLDKIEIEYKKIEHYKKSFEIGVIYTNRAALYLTLALYHSPEEIEKQSNLNISEKLLNTSLIYYKEWENKYKNLSKPELSKLIINDFEDIKKNKNVIIKKRVEDIKLAINEINRRTSVTYTNLGIVKRHQKKFKEAIEYYQNAIKLWKENFTAKNNLRVLLGKEPQKRGLIEKMFPKDRN